MRDLLLKEKLSLKYKKVLDADYKKFENFFQNYKKNISTLISNQEKFSAFINELLETVFQKTEDSSKDKEKPDSDEENSLDKNDETQENENIINEEISSDDFIEKIDNDEINDNENIELSDQNDESNIEFVGIPNPNYLKTRNKNIVTKFDNIVNANKLCD